MHDHTRDPFQLSGLPPPQPPGDPWPAIAAARRRRQRRRVGAWAAAAAVTLALGLSWQLRQGGPGSESGPSAVTAVQQAGPEALAADPLVALVQLSQQLEARLRQLRAQAGAMPSEALIYQVELEDLIAQVDEAINRQPDSRALWSQRVNLLLDLNQLYQRELRREYGLVASL
jgi:hypothetical protein